MKYYIIAGEASGDLHGSNLMKGIYAEDPQAEIRFWGGDCMVGVWAGSTVSETNPHLQHDGLVKHYKEGAVMGFVEVLAKAGKLLKNVKFAALSVMGKILLIPAVMLPLSAFLGFDRLEMAILVAVFATPNAVSSYAMARNYEADHELAGEIITLGTLLSIGTIFVFITLAKSFGWI